VVPHHQVGLVAERAAVDQPAVAEVVVLGHEEPGAFVEPPDLL
jgi:hypothetical protein